MKLRVFIYDARANLGDAIQTFALCRLLAQPCVGIYRDLPQPVTDPESIQVVHGWCGRCVPSDASRCVVAGLHIGLKHEEHIQWIRGVRDPIGVRDSYTRDLLEANGIGSVIVGCPTLTLPRYRGPRAGRFSVDVDQPGTVSLTNVIGDVPWSEQWELARFRLEQLRRAEIVYTNRLHVLLPCLAFGTPVVFPSSALPHVFQRQRLTLAEMLGCEFDVPLEIDVTAWADRFTAFLGDRLQRQLAPVEAPPMPTPYGPSWSALRQLARLTR